MWCPRNTCTKSGELLEDGIGGSGPDKGTGVAVVVLNEIVDASDQFADAPETSPADGLLSDQAEPAFDLVEP